MDIGSKGLKCIQYFKTNYLSSSARFPKFFVAQLILKLIRLLVFFVSMRRQPGINISMRKTLMLEHRHRDPKHLFVRQIWPSHDSQALSVRPSYHNLQPWLSNDLKCRFCLFHMAFET